MIDTSEQTIWERAFCIAKTLQCVLGASDITEDRLLKKLAGIDDLPIPGTVLSIVYEAYTDPGRLQVPVLDGVACESIRYLEDTHLKTFSTEIDHVRRNEVSRILKNVEQSDENDIAFCKSLLIVPMRLRYEKIRGVFIAVHPKQNAYTDVAADVFDHFSDRVALFIDYVYSRGREYLLQGFTSNLISSIGKFKSEGEIFEKVISWLCGDSKIDDPVPTLKWFNREEITIILQHPFYKEKYYLVCENGEVEEDFRIQGEIDEKKFKALIGKEYHIIKNTEGPKAYDSIAELVGRDLPRDYKSWAVIPIRVRQKNVIGLLVLSNRYEEHAYGDELGLLTNVADFAAATLRNYRRDKGYKELDTFRIKNIRHNRHVDDRILYSEAVKTIEGIYGKIEFSVIHRDYKSGHYAIAYPQQDSVNKSIPKVLEAKLEECLYKPEDPESTSESHPFILDDIECHIMPIRAESGISTSFFVIKADKIGNNTKKFIGELAQLIEFKQSIQRKKLRLEKMTSFGKQVTENKDISLDEALKLVYMTTSEIMYTESMYVAILEESTNMINFPLFYENGKKIAVKSRAFKQTKRGRTEEILISKEPILIETEKESKAWYDPKKGRQEKIGSYYAAWIGVPVLNNDRAIGVIAAYHPTKNYLYSDDNIAFLENIATHISDLFSRIELRDKIANNTELKKANDELNKKNIQLNNAKDLIAEREKALSDSLNARDITHGFGNALGSLAINLKQSLKDVEKTIETGEKRHLLYTKIALQNCNATVKKTIGKLKSIVTQEKQDVFLPELIQSRLDEVVIERLLQDKIQSKVVPHVSEQYQTVFIRRSSLSLCLHLLIDNAADALQKSIRMS